MVTYGINNESSARLYTKWNTGECNESLSAIVSLLDQAGEANYQLVISSDLTFQDKNDGKGPLPTQRPAAVKALQAYFTRTGINDTKLASILGRLKAYLIRTIGSSIFDMGKVIQLLTQALQAGTITLDQLAALDGLEGDAFVAKLIEILGKNDSIEDYMTAEGKKQKAVERGMTELSRCMAGYKSNPRTATLEDVKKALATVRGIAGFNEKYDVALVDIGVIPDADKLIADDVERQQRAISTREALVKCKTPLEVASLYLLYQTENDADPELQKLIGGRAIALMQENPSAALQDSLVPIITLSLASNERLISFTDDADSSHPKTYNVIIRRTGSTWALPKGSPLTGYSIKVVDGQLVVQKDGRLPSQRATFETRWVADGAEKYFTALGIDPYLMRQIYGDGVINRSEFKQIDIDNDHDGRKVTEVAFNFISSGSFVNAVSDEEITADDLKALFETVLGKDLQGMPEAEKKIIYEHYLTAEGFVLIPDEKIAETLLEGGVRMLSSGVMEHVSLANQPAVKQVICDITGRTTYADNIDLSPEQLQTLIVRLGIYAQLPPEAFMSNAGVESPLKNYWVETTGKLLDKGALGDASKFLAWLNGETVDYSLASGSSGTSGKKLTRVQMEKRNALLTSIQAARTAEDALRLYKDDGGKLLTSSEDKDQVFTSIARKYYEIGNYEKAFEYWQKLSLGMRSQSMRPGEVGTQIFEHYKNNPETRLKAIDMALMLDDPTGRSLLLPRGSGAENGLINDDLSPSEKETCLLYLVGQTYSDSTKPALGSEELLQLAMLYDGTAKQSFVAANATEALQFRTKALDYYMQALALTKNAYNDKVFDAILKLLQTWPKDVKGSKVKPHIESGFASPETQTVLVAVRDRIVAWEATIKDRKEQFRDRSLTTFSAKKKSSEKTRAKDQNTFLDYAALLQFANDLVVAAGGVAVAPPPSPTRTTTSTRTTNTEYIPP